MQPLPGPEHIHRQSEFFLDHPEAFGIVASAGSDGQAALHIDVPALIDSAHHPAAQFFRLFFSSVHRRESQSGAEEENLPEEEEDDDDAQPEVPLPDLRPAIQRNFNQRNSAEIRNVERDLFRPDGARI